VVCSDDSGDGYSHLLLLGQHVREESRAVLFQWVLKARRDDYAYVYDPVRIGSFLRAYSPLIHFQLSSVSSVNASAPRLFVRSTHSRTLFVTSLETGSMMTRGPSSL